MKGFVKAETLVSLQPAPDLGRVVDRRVVDDDVHVQLGRQLGVDFVEEAPCTADFSSTQSTTALSGGFMYKPMLATARHAAEPAWRLT
jgi:hypothetical protein